MSRTRHLCTQVLALGTSILVAICMLAIAAAAQTTPAPACSAYQSIPLPAEAEKAPIPKTPPACASYRSYRGIGRPINYSKARTCAWQERLAQEAGLGQGDDEPDAFIVGGSLILADIYFNGAGVQRNIPLAMRFACESEEGMATLALPEIAKLNGAPPTPGPFEFCDYATTTFTQTFCSDYASEIEDDRRSHYYDSLKSSMTPEQKAAFENLLAAKKAYIDAHASEVYQGGSIHNIRTLGSQDILEDLFHTEVVHFERKQWPPLSANQVTTADASLRRQYEKTLKQLRSHTKDEIQDGEVTAAGLSSAEKTWETYRDAWVAFATLRYPTALPAIRAQITLDRYRLLKTIS